MSWLRVEGVARYPRHCETLKHVGPLAGVGKRTAHEEEVRDATQASDLKEGDVTVAEARGMREHVALWSVVDDAVDGTMGR